MGREWKGDQGDNGDRGMKKPNARVVNIALREAGESFSFSAAPRLCALSFACRDAETQRSGAKERAGREAYPTCPKRDMVGTFWNISCPSGDEE